MEYENWLPQEAGGFEFEVSLVYRASSRKVRAIPYVEKQSNQPKPYNQKRNMDIPDSYVLLWCSRLYGNIQE